MFKKTRLPHYYFGDDISQDDKLARNNDSISLGVNSIVEDVCASEPNLSRIPSPASSLASTKKLEWDSGADIGYSNAYSFKKSRRSKSFPSLNMDLSISQINKSDEAQGDVSIENKVADDITENNSSKNSQCTKSQEKKNNFKHSTPYEEKMVSRSSRTSVKSNCQTESVNLIVNKNIDECLQTTLVKNCCKSVQTDSISLKDDQKTNKSIQTDTIKSLSSSSGSSGNSLSKSSSFRYISCANTDILGTADSKLTQKLEESLSKSSKSSKSKSLKSSESKSESSNSSKPSTEESLSSHSSPLAKMIATQQSKHLISDIDKSLTILQKFIHSKNYTPETKKFYAKKIVNKIISSKYSEDSSSSSLATKSSEKPIEPSILLKIANSKDDLSEETPDKSSRGVQCDPVQKHISTGTDKNKKLIKKLEEIMSKNDKITEKAKNKSEIDLSNKSWKEAETLSEKLFEARRKSVPSSLGSTHTTTGVKDESKKDDYIIQHSKKERKRQLSWINNEISYLHRLKELLQKHDTSSNASPDLGIKLDSQNHSAKSSEKSHSIITNNSSLSDIENRFYKEFGSCTSLTSEKQETLKKLSKLLSNDQIKHLIDNDAKEIHKSCECSTKNTETQKISGDKTSRTEHKTYPCPSQKSDSKTYVCPSQKTDCLSHEEKNHSFNSHSYKFYDNLINSCNESQKVPNEQQALKSDAGIQCTLKKKKCRPEQPMQTDDSARSTEYSHDRNNVEIFYKNTSHFHNSDSQSTEYGKVEDTVPYFSYKQQPRSPKKGKENYYRQRKSGKYRKVPEKPVAYFLTFEEESLGDFYQDTRKSALENVTVKVPKLPKAAPRNKPNPPVFKKPKPKKPKPVPAEEKNENNDSGLRRTVETVTYKVQKSHTTDQRTATNVDSEQKTLQDYLLTNRPDYVRIADWRRSIISDQADRRSRSIFTCAEMRKQASEKYNKLPEVQNKVHQSKIVNQKKHNRCMAHIFAKKLQKKTLKGELSIATCMNVMSADSL